MPTTIPIADCSFCLRPNTEVDTLVAGPGVYICNDCVGLCAEVIARKPVGVAQSAPWEQTMSLTEVMTHLPRVAAATSQVERHLDHWVAKARELGASWAKIGEALGMARQSAWERFASQ